LAGFTKVDHEIITILVPSGVIVKFNDHYPVKRVADEEWVWEYSNLDPKDDNLKDTIKIYREDNPPIPESTYNSMFSDFFDNIDTLPYDILFVLVVSTVISLLAAIPIVIIEVRSERKK
jgi:hypothetical protein